MRQQQIIFCSALIRRDHNKVQALWPCLGASELTFAELFGVADGLCPQSMLYPM